MKVTAVKQKNMDMLNGPMLKNIFIFAIPIILSTILQHAFHAADVAVIGKFCGERELAAIGSTATIVNLLTSLVAGFAGGCNVVIAQFIGAGKSHKIKSAVSTGIFLAVVSGVLSTAIGIVFAPSILRLMDTPSDIISLAILYIRLYFLGVPFIMIYNFIEAMLRSKGETKKPTLCLISGGILNVILNFIFVTRFNMGVAGVSVATTIANMVICALSVSLLIREKGEFHLNLKNIKPDKKIIIDVAKVGLPIGIQNTMFPLANTIFQSGINTLGTAVIAGNATATSIETFSHAVNNGFSQTTVSFVSQNYGAKNISRCKKATRECAIVSLLVTCAVNTIMYLFYDTICGLFTNDMDVLFFSKQRSQIIYLTLFASVLMNTYTNSLRAMERSAVASSVSIFGVCAIRIIWRYTAFELVKNYSVLIMGFAISCAITATILFIFYVQTIKKLEKQYS